MKKRKIILILTIVLGLILFANMVLSFEPIVLVGDELQLDNQSGWNYYDGTDSVIGGYLGWMYGGTATLTGTIQLPSAIPAGEYYIFAKGTNYNDCSLNISLGENTNNDSSDDSDWNGKWTNQIKVNTSTGADNITITLIKQGNISGTEKYLLTSLYITDNEAVNITKYDVIVDMTYPAVMDDSSPIKGNVIENGNFEVGMGHGWGMYETTAISILSLWDNSTSFYGYGSAKMPLDNRTNNYGSYKTLTSKVYSLKPNKKYTLSAWVKTSGGQTSVTLRLVNSYPPHETLWERDSISNAFTINSSWRRINVTGYVLDYPTSDYQVDIRANNLANQYLWIDAIQLEEGNMTDYSPINPLEFGLNTNQPGNIYYEDESLTADLIIYNHNPVQSNATVLYEIYDFQNNRVKQGAKNYVVPANYTNYESLNISTGKRGIFRIVLWLNNTQGSEEEVVYSIIPRPQISGFNENSMMGIHGNFYDFQLEALQKMGIKWIRALSPGSIFRWGSIEPSFDDNFIWHDDDVALAKSHNISILGTIGTNFEWPAWADNGGVPNLDEWEEFVGQLVTHYKGNVSYWEIWNEPIYVFEPAFYANMSIRAANAIHANDPDAKIVGMGGVHDPDWVLNVTGYMGSNWTDYMDYVATHIYPSGADPTNPATTSNFVEFKEKIIDPYNMPVWNTETGDKDSGVYTGKNSNFVAWGETILPNGDGERYYEGFHNAPINVIKNFFYSTGNGLTKYFYYDSRVISNPSYFIHHFTTIEYDSSIRAKGIMYSVAGYFIDNTIAIGNLSIEKSYSFLYNKSDAPLLVLWSNDSYPKRITVSLNESQFIVYDIMGNEIDINDSRIEFGTMPVYIMGVGVGIDVFKESFETGSVSNITDTKIPHVSITDAPRGSILENSSFRVRWLAIDDISLPVGDNEPNYNPNSILYSYRLYGHSSWSNWTASIYGDYANISSGKYVFEVIARDEAGNNASKAIRSIIIGDYSSNCTDMDNDGYGEYDDECVYPENDCDDSNIYTNPGMTEVCNSIDDDCDSLVDEENASECLLFYKDFDNDGYGVFSDKKCLCSSQTPYTRAVYGDCDDQNEAMNNGVGEICDDGFDNDCDNLVDTNDSDCYSCPYDVISYWDFNELSDSTLKDSCGLNDGINYGAVINSSGVIGTAYSFNNDSYISIPHSASLNFSKNNFSISLWINIRQFTNNAGIFWKRVDDINRLSITISGTNLKFRQGDALSNFKDSDASSINTYAWKHIVWTLNRDNNVSVYIDGMLNKTANISNIIGDINPTVALEIARSQTAYFNGSIDDIAIFNKSLTANQINEIYQNGINGLGIGAYEYVGDVSNCEPADINSDGVITDSEMQAYTDRWIISSSDVSMNDLMFAMNEWKGGCG